MEKILENLIEAERIINSADHLISVTIPMIKNNKLLINALIEIKKAIVKCINSILQYEYLFRRIKLHKKPNLNFETFTKKCSKRYKIESNEIKKINELFEIIKKHEKSPFEFVRKENLVILSDNLQKKTISREDVKEFLILAKTILFKVKSKMEKRF